VVEEAALGDSGFAADVVDRGGGVAFGTDGMECRAEQSQTRLARHWLLGGNLWLDVQD